MEFFNVIVLSMICEAVWETIKMVIPVKLEKWIDKICVIGIGIFLSIASGIDFLSLLGVPLKVHLVGFILTGLLISRGSNFMHDILATINNMQQKTKESK